MKLELHYVKLHGMHSLWEVFSYCDYNLLAPVRMVLILAKFHMLATAKAKT